jgi:hypothetical protein
VEWAILLRGSQLNPIQTILFLGREILCINARSSDTWVFALHANGGELLWQVDHGGDKRQILKMVGWNSEYLYLTGEITVESNLQFARKVWLREGHQIAGIAWYETNDSASQKYDAIPEWHSVVWKQVSELENSIIASTTDVKYTIKNETLVVDNLIAKKVIYWNPPVGSVITSVAFQRQGKPIVALSTGHICMLRE